MAGELEAGLEVAKAVAQIALPLLPVDEAVQLAEELLKVYGSGGVVELTEEELDLFQRQALEGML